MYVVKEATMIHSMIVESESRDWTGLIQLSVIVDRKSYTFTIDSWRVVEHIKNEVRRGLFGNAMCLLKSRNINNINGGER